MPTLDDLHQQAARLANWRPTTSSPDMRDWEKYAVVDIGGKSSAYIHFSRAGELEPM